MITFGPLTSRRLGYSLGVNHIPAKYCSYDCIYCQVGPTKPLTIKRQIFYDTQTIQTEIEQKLLEVKQQGKTVDAITFVPDGEPCLDQKLGEHLQALKPLGIKLAVITNATFLMFPEVREALFSADWVSVKVDSVNERIWHKINRPYGRLNMEHVLDGITAFSKEFLGDLVTETMLVQEINDDGQMLKQTAKFISSLKVKCAYISVPNRPPMEAWVHPPDAKRLTAAYHVFRKKIDSVEILGLVEPKPFVGSSGIREVLLSTAAVHPLDQQTVQSMLDEAGVGWDVVDRLLSDGDLKKAVYMNNVFFLTNLTKRR
ncbi:MAG: radical SAM protein [Anaerolineaceae bacterium]|nr:radical SAM protein [Anaerolineaceae bacterium]